MISAVNTARRRGRYLSACAGKPFFGCVLPVHLALFGKTSGCFFAAPTLAVDANGGGVIAAGHANPEELASFLGFLGKHRLLTDGPCPAGWRLNEPYYLYVLEPFAALPLGPAPAGLALNEAADAGRVADLLFAERPERRDSFYAELCTKRNHGMARVWALERDGEIVCTVGAYAIHGGEAYMACGETVEALRGQGIGGWLITKLADTLAAEGLRVTFLCRGERVRFYERLGFARAGSLGEYTDTKDEET